MIYLKITCKVTRYGNKNAFYMHINIVKVVINSSYLPFVKFPITAKPAVIAATPRAA